MTGASKVVPTERGRGAVRGRGRGKKGRGEGDDSLAVSTIACMGRGWGRGRDRREWCVGGEKKDREKVMNSSGGVCPCR